MVKTLILLMIVLSFLVVSCGVEDEDNSCVNEDEERIVPCSTDISKEQKQVCQEGIWVDEGPCLCKAGETFCLSHKGLNWSNVSSEEMVWDDAIEYCKDIGGHLPTISELRTLIINCPQTETGGECRISDDRCLSEDDCLDEFCRGCLSDEITEFSVLGDEIWLYSFSELSNFTSLHWGVDFKNGQILYGSKGGEAYFRCVK